MRVITAEFNLEEKGWFTVLVALCDDGSVKVMAKLCGMCDSKPTDQTEYTEEDWNRWNQDFWGDWEDLENTKRYYVFRRQEVSAAALLQMIKLLVT